MELVVGGSAYWHHSGERTELMKMACEQYAVEVSATAPPEGHASDEVTEELPPAPELDEVTTPRRNQVPPPRGQPEEARRRILSAYKKAGGAHARAARLLDLSTRQLGRYRAPCDSQMSSSGPTRRAQP